MQRQSTTANRAQVAEESAKAKVTAREAARLERQRKLAEMLRQKADAEDAGDDIERQKNWEYTIEENDEWEKKLARKARRADFEFHSEYSILPRLRVLCAERSRRRRADCACQMMRTRRGRDTRRTWTSSSPTSRPTTARRKSHLVLRRERCRRLGAAAVHRRTLSPNSTRRVVQYVQVSQYNVALPCLCVIP